jgi:sterol desaturase/sphingolipid hydroxylase (fatty acid hydroxylase superfamily)
MQLPVIVVLFCLDAGKALFLVAPVYVLIEVLLPKARVSWRSRVQSATFIAISTPVAALVFAGYAFLWNVLGLQPLWTLRLGDRLAHLTPWPWVGMTAAAVLAAIVADFFFYWMHRAQHRFFWRFHSVHHAIEELSALSCYHHASEEFFRVLFFVTPMSLLVVEPGPAPFVLGAIVANHTYFVHSSTRLNWGPLRYIFDDNRFHRIHHSKDPAHHNKNFGGFCTLWDQLFGTAYFPARDEWPDVGLDDMAEPQSMWAYLVAPFRRGRAVA